MSSRLAARRLFPCLVVLASAVIAACGVTDGVAPTTRVTADAADDGTAGNDSSDGTQGGAGTNGGGSGADSSSSGGGSRTIAQWEADEKRRVAAEQERQKVSYDSLKALWQRVLDDESGAWDDQLVCDPLQYVATVKVVGPAGADIDFGPHKLRIPPGALNQPTVITAEAPSSLQVLAKFSPHGTIFTPGRHPTLELSYKHCRNPAGHTARIGYLGPDGRVIEWPPSQDFPEEAMVRGIIGHFSPYIVAY